MLHIIMAEMGTFSISCHAYHNYIDLYSVQSLIVWCISLSLTCRQLIYNYPEQLFSDAGVMAIEHADFEGIERLALVLGGEIVSTFGNPEKVKIGSCDLIEEVMIGEDKVS